MSSLAVRLISPRVTIACAALLALSACERAVEEPNAAAAELAWARAALERNPRIEVVASDHQAGVFTVRDKRSGDVQVVKLSEIAAVPVAQLAATESSAPPAAASPSAADPQFATEPAVATPQTAAAESAATSDAQAQQIANTTTPATAAEANNYTIERTDGQLRVTGPGVSIVSSGKPSAGGAQKAGQRAAEPIICEGRRMLHFDNRNIYVDGDALTARDGCELFITNSRIVASGTGVVVRDAVVHIANSHIEGAAGSFAADADSKLYVRDSTFQGVSRRDELAMVQDQGGNRWR